MAEPVEFEDQNLVLLPPPGSEDAVVPLPVRRLEGQVVSCWRPTPEELAEIAETGVIWISIWGLTHPPVLVTGHKAHVI